ncbi:MAG: polyphosphate polymerase domain-containing protein [Lachnospiraceae bacterium]|nr:polyphosphate polymerase domain-containing protein [Lachnospiraceae bacterium]
MKEQMTFKRYEIKYMISPQELFLIKAAMSDRMTADVHGKSTVCSLYFDTPDYLLARRSMEHPLYKEKLRLRSYGTVSEDNTVFVELKKKYDSVVYKRRIALDYRTAMGYLKMHTGSSRTSKAILTKTKEASDRQICQEIDYVLSTYHDLAPAILLTYEREAYYGRKDHDLRITFDQNILWRDHHLCLSNGIYGTPLLPEGRILMEVKTAGAIPLWLVRVLSSNHIYKTSFSKYGAAYVTICQNKQNGGHYHYA